MNDLLKKLNVLVKASIHDVLGDEGATRRSPINPAKLGKDIDREIAMLRERINQGLSYEDEIQAQVKKAEAEVASWDEKADTAVAAGDEANARYAIEQMQYAQRRVAMAEADLRDHQQVIQELILRVNTLEAAVADVRRAEQEKSAQEAPPEESQRGAVLSDVLKDVRERVAHMGDLITAKDEVSAERVESQPADDAGIDDDLEARRQRLSKPKQSK